ACVLALLDRRATVGREHLVAGIRLVDFSMASAEWALASSRAANPVAERLLAALDSTPAGLTRTDIRNLLRNNRTAAEIEQALGWLAEEGLATRRRAPGASFNFVERWFATR